MELPANAAGRSVSWLLCTVINYVRHPPIFLLRFFCRSARRIITSPNAPQHNFPIKFTVHSRAIADNCGVPSIPTMPPGHASNRNIYPRRPAGMSNPIFIPQLMVVTKERPARIRGRGLCLRVDRPQTEPQIERAGRVKRISLWGLMATRKR